MDDLYREVIIEHYKHPSYRGHLDPHDIQFADNNPLCGDHIEITLRTGRLHAGHTFSGAAERGRRNVNFPPHTLQSPSHSSYS